MTVGQRSSVQLALLAAATMLVLAGCAGEPVAAPPELTTGALPDRQNATSPPGLAAGQAQLYLSRVGGVLYAGAPATVKVNGHTLAELWPGTSQTVVVPAGPVKVSAEAWSYPGTWVLDLNAEAGQVYNLQVAPREESIVSSSMPGPIGGTIDAGGIGTKSGAFQLRLVSSTP